MAGDEGGERAWGVRQIPVGMRPLPAPPWQTASHPPLPRLMPFAAHLRVAHGRQRLRKEGPERRGDLVGGVDHLAPGDPDDAPPRAAQPLVAAAVALERLPRAVRAVAVVLDDQPSGRPLPTPPRTLRSLMPSVVSCRSATTPCCRPASPAIACPKGGGADSGRCATAFCHTPSTRPMMSASLLRAHHGSAPKTAVTRAERARGRRRQERHSKRIRELGRRE